MATRNFILSGAASLALAGTLLAATPGFAQDVETQETEQLNATQATLPPVPSPEDKAAYEAALSQHDQALTQHNQAEAQYNAELQDYQAKRRAYSQAQQNYDTRSQAYAAQSDIYQDEAANYDADRNASNDTVVIKRPDRFDYPDGHDRLWELGVLDNPEQEIGGVPVEDRAGYVVGHFRRIMFQDNIPKAVIVLNNNKMVAVDEEHFRYDPDDLVVVADMDFDELNSMPARF